MVYQLVPVAGGALQLMTRLPAVQRGIDAATRIIYPRARMTADMMARASALEANSSADDVKPPLDPNRPQPPGYDAATGAAWDINNQKFVDPQAASRALADRYAESANPEPRPLMIGPRHGTNNIPSQMSPEAISGMYRREFGMDPPQRSATDQFEQETGRDINMQREAPPLPPRRPADLPRKAVPLPPERPAEFNQARQQAGNVLSSRQMYQNMDPNDERAGTMQFILAAAKEAQEQRAAREAAGKAMGGAAGYSHGGYASGGSTASTASSGSGSAKDAALLKALEIIHHMVTRG